MSLRLVCGPNGAGKTAHAVAAFLDAAARGANPLFIAPSGPDARHFHREILRAAGSGGAPGVLIGGKVGTFDGLCAGILDASGARARIISPGERFLIVRAVIDSTQLHSLAGSSVFDGFVRSFSELTAELASLGIGVEQLGKALRSWAGGDEWRKGLNKDLYRLLDRYGAVLADAGIIDAEGAQRRALTALAADAGLLAHRAVIVDGFWDFTSLQHDVIEHLALTADEVLVTLPYASGLPAYAAPSLHFTRLASLAGSESLMLDAPSASDRSPALEHLAGNLFQEKLTDFPAGGSLRVLTGAGIRGQAEVIAAEVLKLCRSGQNLDEIAVVCRDLGPDLHVLSAVLKAYDVPYQFDAPLPLPLTAVGRAALSLLDFATGSRSRASLLAYLRSPLSGLPLPAVDEFDSRCRRYGIEEPAVLLMEWKLRGGRPLDEVNRLEDAAARGAGELADELCRLLQDLLRKQTAAGTALAELQTDLAALEVLQLLCRQAGHVAKLIASEARRDDRGSDAAARLLERAIKQAVLRIPAASRQCVRLLDPHRILNQRFDIVFVCGMVEKQFPNLGREDSFFSDSDRRVLAEGHGLSLDRREHRLDQERFLYFRTLSRARERVYLCYPSCDKEGRPSIKSLFVDDTLRLFNPESVITAGRTLSDQTYPPGEAPTRSEALRSLAVWSRRRDGASVKALIASDPAGLGERLTASLAASRLDAACVRDPEIVSALKERTGFQVTELQTYLRCPFRYFVEALLRPLEITPAAHGEKRGRVIHDILCRFGAQLKRSGLFLNAEADPAQIAAARRQMSDFIEDEFLDAELDLETLILRNELEFHLNRYIDREVESNRDLEYFDFEVGFGGARGKCGDRNNTENVLPVGDFYLKGRLDRVDREPGSSHALVIDYKSSRSAISQADFGKRKEIQIPLYILALREAFGLEPVGGEYYALRGDERGGLYLAGYEQMVGAASSQIRGKDFVFADEFEQHLEEAKMLASEAVAGIRAGDFRARPLDKKKDCRWCGLAGVCRLAARARLEGSDDDDA